MSVLGNEKGAIKQIISIVLAVFLIYTGYLFAIPFYKYESLKSECNEIANLVFSQQKSVGMIYNRAKELGIPLHKEDIIVNVDKKADTVTIETGWYETVSIAGIYDVELDFDINVKK